MLKERTAALKPKHSPPKGMLDAIVDQPSSSAPVQKDTILPTPINSAQEVAITAETMLEMGMHGVVRGVAVDVLFE